MKKVIFCLLISTLMGCGTSNNKDKKWVFILAGQSNMSGRGVVESQDTITNKSINTLNKDLQLELAREPLHFYEPDLAGVGPGFAFGKELKKSVPSNVEIILVPCAIGGSSIDQWLGDSLHRGVHLYSNFKTRLDTITKIGTVKAILWLQGESDANSNGLSSYKTKLEDLFQRFRRDVENSSLPILVGEIGTYSEPESKNQNWKSLNNIINDVAKEDKNTYIISSEGLTSNPDHVHYNSESQRTLGKRFANKYLNVVYQKQ